MLPAWRAGRIRALPAAYRPVLQHEVCGHEPTTPLHQAADECVGDAERRVGDDVEVAPRQSEVRRVRLNHDDGGAELGTELRGSAGMELDGDDPRAALHEWPRERAEAGADVEDEIAGPEPGVSDELLRPAGIELMPSPGCPWRGHGGGGPSRGSSSTRFQFAPASAVDLTGVAIEIAGGR